MKIKLCPVCNNHPTWKIWRALPNLDLRALNCEDGRHRLCSSYYLNCDDAINNWNEICLNFKGEKEAK